MIKFRGTISHIFYPKKGLDENKNMQRAGFVVKSNMQGKKNIRCFGFVPQIQIGDYFEFEGEFDDSTFSIKRLMRIDDDEQGATAMLTYCFGPKTSQKIIHSIEDNPVKAWDLFKNHQDVFREKIKFVMGVGPKKVQKALTKYEDHIVVESIFERFHIYGLSLSKSLSIYDAWGNDSLRNIETNPYSLIQFKGITFEVIDKIGLLHYKLEKTNSNRVYAGVQYVMNYSETCGDVFCDLEGPNGLVALTSSLLKVDEPLIREEIFNLLEKKKICIEDFQHKKIVYLPYMYNAEQGIASLIKKLVNQMPVENDWINNEINEYETDHGFQLATMQREAVETAIKNQFSIISGPPGSGKTTIIDCICTLLKKENPRVTIKLAAPTGKAAKRMSESTGMDASTVHRLLEYNPQTGEFNYNASHPFHTDVLIVDEFSMMGLILTYKFLLAVPNNGRIIFVGDKNQLPSVDAGKVLEDLLNVEMIPHIILNKIYRQGNDSSILTRALDVSHGKLPNLEDSKDFTFWEEDNIKYLIDGVLGLYLDECEKYGIDNVMFLTPMNKYDLGVNNLNGLIQEQVNPLKLNDPEIKSGKNHFRLNDRVIQLTNEEDYEVYNGMIGKIIDITKEDKSLDIKDSITVDFGDGVICEYLRDRFENIKHAYAMTIHKSQGSEAKSVIMLCHSSQKFMLTKKLVYTGMTRAKTHLHIVGEKTIFKQSLIKKERPRNSRLTYCF